MTPMGAFVAGQRTYRERREKLVARGRKDEENRREKTGQADGDVEDDVEIV